MKRWWAGGWGIMALTLAHGQMTAFEVLDGGVPAGTAWLSQSLQSDGSKQVVLVLRSGTEPNVVVLRMESVYAADGLPIRQLHRVETKDGGKLRQWRTGFGPKGAEWVVDDAAPAVRPWPAAINRQAKAEFWFIRDRPRIGTMVTQDYFDVQQGEFQRMTTTYEGPARITVQGKPVSGHRLRTRRAGRVGEAVVDDQGIPWTLTEGRLRLVRKPAVVDGTP